MVNSKARAAIESLYDGKCTIYVNEPHMDDKTKVTKFSEKVFMSDEPCRISYKAIPEAGSGTVAAVSQVIKLFISPDVEVPAGSKIVVTQNDVTQTYARTGEPAVYSSHQEVMMVLFERYA